MITVQNAFFLDLCTPIALFLITFVLHILTAVVYAKPPSTYRIRSTHTHAHNKPPTTRGVHYILHINELEAHSYAN